jgi:hypothetical protein
VRIAALLTALVAAVGCGAASSGTGATPSTDLAVTVWPEGRGEGDSSRFTLRCAPAAGTLPRRATACQRLATMASPFAPLRKDLACTQIYGGPQQAVIAGTFRGHRIWTLVKATDGCEIARAKKLAFLLPGFSAAAGS